MARESFSDPAIARDPQRALRRGEGRSRGASRRRRQLPRRRLGVHPRARLAAHGVRDARRARVLRRHVLPAAARCAACRRSRRCSPPSTRPGANGVAELDETAEAVAEALAAASVAPTAGDLPGARRRSPARSPPSPRTRTASTAASGEPRSSRSPRCSASSRTSGADGRAPRRALAAAHGGIAAPRSRRGRLLPVRHARRLERAALRAHAHRQRPAPRRRARSWRRRRSAGVRCGRSPTA